MPYFEDWFQSFEFVGAVADENWVFEDIDEEDETLVFEYEDEALPEEFQNYQAMFFDELKKVGVLNRNEIPNFRMFAEMYAFRWTICPWWLYEIDDEEQIDEGGSEGKDSRNYAKDVAKVRRRIEVLLKKYTDL